MAFTESPSDFSFRGKLPMGSLDDATFDVLCAIIFFAGGYHLLRPTTDRSPK
eukprot:gene58420-77946_t